MELSPIERDRLRDGVERAWSTGTMGGDTREQVDRVIFWMDHGQIRTAEKTGGEWVVHEWVKKAILLYFKLAPMQTVVIGPRYEYHDKIPLKRNLDAAGVRLVPPGHIRYGAFVGKGTVVMPGYVNIGAYVGEGSMIDTWATIGSCAQIGNGVHISGGVGIGGVLEPPSARPVVIEDGAFIGSRCIIVEGVQVGEEAVLGANVTLTASTPIIDVTGPGEVIHRGVVPPGSVVIPGVRNKSYPAGEYGVPCALIVGRRSESTDRKTSLEQVLREYALGQ